MASPAQTPAAPEFKPHVFGKFFLLQRLAVGGMAEIFRAKVAGAEGFEKELVVKRILPARSQDQGFIKMLVNEAKLTVQLTHNNVTQIYECGSIDGTYFISMELVNGVSLKDMMVSFARAGTAITPEQAIFMVLQLLQGLEYAHKRTDGQGNPLRIIHCDVSPDNALVSWQGEVKLLDFGIARAATGLSNYKEGMLMGKLGYVAPEQASLDRPWDHRVDVFAAGIILYELLTKQKPFQRAVDVDSLIQSRQGKVVPPSSIDERLPKDLDAIVLRALAGEPRQSLPGRALLRRRPRRRALPHAPVGHPGPPGPADARRVRGPDRAAARGPRPRRAGDEGAAQRGRAAGRRGLRLGGARRDHRPGPPGPPDPELGAPRIDLDVDRASSRPAPLGPERIRTIRVGAGRAILLGIVAGLAVAVAGFAAAPWMRDGVLVVSTSPPGAQVTVDGRPVPGTSPVVVEGIQLSSSHHVEAALPGHRPAAIEVARSRDGWSARSS